MARNLKDTCTVERGTVRIHREQNFERIFRIGEIRLSIKP